MPYIKEFDTLTPQLYVLAHLFQVEPCHWIAQPKGDDCLDWCAECGEQRLATLRLEDPENAGEYILDGGWRSESDSPCWCEGCGVRLDMALTDYGASEELSSYVCEGIHGIYPEVAYDLAELADHYDYLADGKDRSEADLCLDLLRTFIALKHNQEVIQPCQWADDGGRGADIDGVAP